MDQEDINLQLSAAEINLILEGVGSMPFVKVYALIGKIQQQAAGQINKTADTADTATGGAK